MATTSGRSELHSALRKALGPGPGDDLIDMLAPLEREELARRKDIEALDARIDALEVRLNARVDRLEGHLDARIEAQISRLLYTLVPIMVSLAVLVFAAVKL